MNIYDRDGSLHQAAQDGTIIFAAACICGMVLIVCAAFLALSMIGN